MYYNGIKIASFIRDGVWIRENAEDYHQVFFKDAGIGIDNIPVYVSIVVCKDPVSFFKDVFYIELLPYQEELINDMIKENQNEEKEIC